MGKRNASKGGLKEQSSLGRSSRHRHRGSNSNQNSSDDDDDNSSEAAHTEVFVRTKAANISTFEDPIETAAMNTLAKRENNLASESTNMRDESIQSAQAKSGKADVKRRAIGTKT